MKSQPNVRWNIAGPAILGAVALVVAGYLAWLTFQHDDAPDPRVEPEQPVTVVTDAFVNRGGGYSLEVPKGMKAARQGAATQIRDPGRTLMVTVTPTGKGSLADNNSAVLRAMVSTYRTVHLATNERQRIDERAAVASYGQAVTKRGVSLRFVLITVKGTRHNFAISTFTAADSDPKKVLPQVRAIANGFHVLPAKAAAKQ